MEQLEFNNLRPEEESAKPKPLPKLEEERDCPGCGGSGPCRFCERGVTQELEWRREAKEKKTASR
jgi:hypothetical protein